jgi:hypothetical protein
LEAEAIAAQKYLEAKARVNDAVRRTRAPVKPVDPAATTRPNPISGTELRIAAIAVAAKLPLRRDDALAILAEARSLVENYVYGIPACNQ